MSLPIHVNAYSGFKANERPRQFVLAEEIYEIAAVLDQWHEPSAMYFRVRSTEGNTYLLRYDEGTDEWALQTGRLIGFSVIGKRGPYEFMLSEPARCPNCKHTITEKTLIEPRH
jgi:hypothetical protein